MQYHELQSWFTIPFTKTQFSLSRSLSLLPVPDGILFSYPLNLNNDWTKLLHFLSTLSLSLSIPVYMYFSLRNIFFEPKSGFRNMVWKKSTRIIFLTCLSRLIIHIERNRTEDRDMNKKSGKWWWKVYLRNNGDGIDIDGEEERERDRVGDHHSLMIVILEPGHGPSSFITWLPRQKYTPPPPSIPGHK